MSGSAIHGDTGYQPVAQRIVQGVSRLDVLEHSQSGVMACKVMSWREMPTCCLCSLRTVDKSTLPSCEKGNFLLRLPVRYNMGDRIMKTTIEITDDLAIKAKALAAKKGITLRAVIEQGIRRTLETEQSLVKFQLEDKSVGGNGLCMEFRDKSWPEIRDAAYEGRGS